MFVSIDPQTNITAIAVWDKGGKLRKVFTVDTPYLLDTGCPEYIGLSQGYMPMWDLQNPKKTLIIESCYAHLNVMTYGKLMQNRGMIIRTMKLLGFQWSPSNDIYPSKWINRYLRVKGEKSFTGKVVAERSLARAKQEWPGIKFSNDHETDACWIGKYWLENVRVSR